MRRPHVALIGAVSLLVAACSNGSTSGGSASPSVSGSPSQATVATVPADELAFPGKLLICSDLPYPPNEYFDANGNPIGSDIEIGQEIGTRLGLQPEIVNSVFDTIVAAVNSGKCDIIIAAMGITPDRLKQMDMIPYLIGGSAAIVPKGNPEGIQQVLDLCGKSIAAQTGTNEADYVTGAGVHTKDGLTPSCAAQGDPAPTLKPYPKDSDALLALLSGQVDAYLTGLTSAAYYAGTRANELEISGFVLKGETEGIGIPKGKAGLESGVKTALRSMIADGTYLQILTKYHLESATIAP